jgi:P4 family phage/plasmid primase-like protien
MKCDESSVDIKPTKKKIRVVTAPASKNIKYKDFHDFMFKHLIKKEDKSEVQPTHTRIGDSSLGIHGGSYHIPEEEYELFMKLYYDHVIIKNTPEDLTEKQLAGSPKSPIAIDIDLHFAYDTKERLYSKEHIEDLRNEYLDELKKMFQFDEDTRFQVYVFEKPSVNRVEVKNITKDGIHMIIGIQCDHNAQKLLRQRIMAKVQDMWKDLPIVNTWNDVFDEGISNGYTNWQLYGSRKPNHEAYQLTHAYEVSLDVTDNEWQIDTVDIQDILDAENFKKLSVRYANHPQFFYKPDFIRQLDTTVAAGGLASSKKKKSTANLSDISSYMMDDVVGIQELRNIKSAEDLEFMKNRFLDGIQPSQYILKETYEYTMILPPTYYENGSYSKWIRVGWALKNTSERLLIVWIIFSAKAKNFKYSSIADLCDMWRNFEKKNSDGVTERSIMYWAMQDAQAEFKRVNKSTVSFYLDQTINSITVDSLNSEKGKKVKGCGDFDIATVLYHLKKGQFKCISVKNNVWVQYKNHRWVKNECGTSLRKMISDDLRDLYMERATQLLQQAAELDPEDTKTKLIRCKVSVITSICTRLASTNDKKNIMTESKELFYDETFEQKMDSNPYLLCFNNGVIDYKEKIFRRGLPEDYITKSTNIDYIPLDRQKQAKIIAEIEDFMYKLFPKSDLREYMWDHLASVLIGNSSVNQTFNLYIGGGQNGKSVLTDLMSHVLGDYKVTAPVALITQQRGKIGGTSPEVVSLKGARYAVMAELTKGEKMNEGVMKELVSGMEPIKARGLYMADPVEFIPQFTLVMCTNEFPEIKTQDHGTWRRIRVVPYESLFTETPVKDDPDKPYQFLLDRNIKDRFEEWRQVFAAILVERGFKTDGVVKDCPIVLTASNEYREREDYLAAFTREIVVKESGAQIRKSHLAEEFKLWYNTNFGVRNASPKDLYEYMDKNYGKNRSGIWKNVRLKLRSDEEDDGKNDSGSEDEVPEIQLQEL